MKKQKSMLMLVKNLLLSSALIVIIIVSPRLVEVISANGFDLNSMMSVLLGRVENQDERIQELEKEIEQLKDELKGEKPPEEKPVVEKPKEEIPVEEKPIEEKPVVVKPIDPKPKDPIVKPVSPISNPTLSVAMHDTSFKLIWSKEDHASLLGYKVVFSLSNPNPSYPNDGSYMWISDKTQHYTYVDNSLRYQGGDIQGYLSPSTTYYVAVTYIYKDTSVTTPSIQVKTPSSFNTPDSEPLPPSKLNVGVKMFDTSFKLFWTQEASSKFVEYKVVISLNNPSPSFPQDGYLVCIDNISTTHVIVDNKTQYQGGDFYGFLMPDTTYYVSVTYIYNNSSATTQSIQVTTPSNMFVPTR